jgi:cell shape-determining protein MreC
MFFASLYEQQTTLESVLIIVYRHTLFASVHRLKTFSIVVNAVDTFLSPVEILTIEFFNFCNVRKLLDLRVYV